MKVCSLNAKAGIKRETCFFLKRTELQTEKNTFGFGATLSAADENEKFMFLISCSNKR